MELLQENIFPLVMVWILEQKSLKSSVMLMKIGGGDLLSAGLWVSPFGLSTSILEESMLWSSRLDGLIWEKRFSNTNCLVVFGEILGEYF